MISIANAASFEGPNVWSRSPVTQVIVRLGSTANDPGVWHAELERQLAEIVGSFARTPSTLTPLDPLPGHNEQSMAGMIAKLAIDLQRATSAEVTFFTSRPLEIDGDYKVVIQHLHPRVGLNAARLAVRVFNHLIFGGDSHADLGDQFARLVHMAASRYFTPANRAIADAAIRRGIPVSVVDPRGMRVELGNGVYRQRIASAITSKTSSVSASIARDKHLTKHYLREAGIPVPEGSVAWTLEQALIAANRVGYPVVVKPIDLGDAVAVFVDLRDDADITACFSFISEAASKASGKLLVERFVKGNEYRALIVDQQIVSVIQRVPAHVTGDGLHTIQELIDRINSDPRRSTRLASPLKPVVVDLKTMRLLERAHLTLDDVPAAGRQVQLKPTGHVSAGGTSRDCTDRLHPENAALLRQAAQVVGLDIAGIDFIAKDIEQSVWATGGAVIEVNDGPVVTTHLYPAEGVARDPGPAIVAMLFPPGQPVRVPVVAVTASDDSPSLARLVADILTVAGRTVGLTTRDGVRIGKLRLHASDPRNPHGPRTLLNNPAVEAAVVEVDAQSIHDHGLGFDPCDVAVIGSFSGLKTPYGEPVETVLLRALAPGGVAVLDASDPDVRALADGSDCSIIFFDIDADGDALGYDLDPGQRAVAVRRESGRVALALLSPNGQTNVASVDVHSVTDPSTLSVVQAAIAGAIGLDLPPAAFQQAVQSFVAGHTHA